MNKGVVAEYRNKFKNIENVNILNTKDINPVLKISDLIISDTSSAVYEFVLLNKPAISYRSTSANIKWLDIQHAEQLLPAIEQIMENDEFKNIRNEIIEAYHPYTDGRSSERMWDAVEEYISRHGVPEERKLSLYRRKKVYLLHGRIK